MVLDSTCFLSSQGVGAVHKKNYSLDKESILKLLINSTVKISAVYLRAIRSRPRIRLRTVTYNMYSKK